MDFYSQYGASSAFTPDLVQRNELDMKHNQVPVLTCEGKCSKHRVTWTTHDFVREYKTGHHTFQQDYCCEICGTIRQFGLTVCRLTLGGESN